MALSYYSSPFYREGQRSELASELARGVCCVCVMNVNSINAIWIRQMSSYQPSVLGAHVQHRPAALTD